MLLAIDVGNTNAVFALHDGERTVGQWRCRTERARTADEYFVWLDQLRQHHGITGRVERVIISSTVPQVVFNLRLLSDTYFRCRPIVVGKPECRLPAPPRVDPNTGVGPDRIVNALAAHDLYGGQGIVVDFGTATTFDLYAQDGAYEGGIIAPGVNLSLKALSEAAAALPHIDVSMPEKVIGTNTLGCMQSGIFWGYLSLVEGLCARMRAEHGGTLKVVGTGGLSPLFARGTDIFDHIEPDLTIHGLVLLDRLNRQEQ